MNKRKNLLLGVLSSIIMLIIILNGKNVAYSVRNGVDLCLRAVIPALFPFFVLSGVMNSIFIGQKIGILTPLTRLCKIPPGTESIVLIGMISGYPVGAQLVAEAYKSGALSRKDAHRMLGFCSNAGPAFLFGILASVFKRTLISFVLWCIHVVSALITSRLLPGCSTNCGQIQNQETITITKSLQNAIKNIATVCGWVVLFRLVLDFLKKWVLWTLPTELQVLIGGCIELSNGCLLLNQVQCEGARFLLASVMLAGGGLCVALQTVSVTDKLGTGYYFQGKLMQVLISLIVSYILQPLIYKGEDLYYIPIIYPILLFIFTFLTAYLLRRKKL